MKLNSSVVICVLSHKVLGPLQSVMQDLHSDDNDEDSEDDDDNDMDSDMERLAHTHLTHHQRRLVNGHNHCVKGTLLIIDTGSRYLPTENCLL